MDFVDAAQVAEAQALDAALNAALLRPAGIGEGPAWYGGVPHCRECDTVIPQARLKAVPGTSLCVDCAAALQD